MSYPGMMLPGMGGGKTSTPQLAVNDNDADDQQTGAKMSEQEAGYMELDGATKDKDCQLVQVDGGVSSDKGCCNEFSPVPSAPAFQCGNCTHVTEMQAKQPNPDATVTGLGSGARFPKAAPQGGM